MHETRIDPAAAAEEEMNLDANETGFLHPAAMVRDPVRYDVLPASTDPKDVPQGWKLHEPLGRWVDPEDPTSWGKVPRNAACPCGTGRKFKHCHGKVA